MKLEFAFALVALLASATAADSTSTESQQVSSVRTLPLIPAHVQRRRRNRALEESVRRRQEAVQVAGLYQGYGTHYIDLWVGTPPQRQTLIVDTGSGVTAFPCSSCKDCGEGHHIDGYFMEGDSSTFEKIACSSCTRGHCSASGGTEDSCIIGMSYQEGSSWSAFECSDASYVGGPHSIPLLSVAGTDSDLDPMHARAFSFRMTFGCQTKLTGLFKTQLADGIMGMDNAATAFWAQMQNSGLMLNKQFSLCFSRQPTASRAGTEAGAMTLGGTETRLHTSKMVYTSDKSNGGFYNVHIRKMYLREGGGGDSSVSSNPSLKVVQLDVTENALNQGNVIVDSGTTDTYFNRNAGSAFQKAFKEFVGKSYNHNPLSLTDEELNNLPTILFQISGDETMNGSMFPDPSIAVGLAAALDPSNPYDVILALPPSHYMEYDEKEEKYIARFYTDEGGGSVLGANTMMGHDVFFDIDNSRIGFAESNCDYTKLVADSGFDISVLPTKQASSSKNKGKSTNPSADSHNKDTPADDTKPYIHPAVEACSDYACRGVVLATLFLFCLCGICCGRACAPSHAYQAQTSELEFPTLSEDDNFDKRYRDDPERDEGGVPEIA